MFRAPTRTLVLRRATPADLQQIMAIERVSFPTPWSETGMYRELRSQDGGVYYAAEVAGRVVGYVGAWMYSGEAHILTIAVDAAYRRQGIGEILMLVILDHARRLGCDRAVLEYRVSNAAARALYAKLGFVEVAVRPHYYTDTHEDAICAVIDDLCTDERGEELARLAERWEQRYEWELVLVRRQAGPGH